MNTTATTTDGMIPMVWLIIFTRGFIPFHLLLVWISYDTQHSKQEIRCTSSKRKGLGQQTQQSPLDFTQCRRVEFVLPGMVEIANSSRLAS